MKYSRLMFYSKQNEDWKGGAMAKRGRPKLWENCSKEEHQEVEEIERLYIQSVADYVKGNISLFLYHTIRLKLLARLNEVEKKYEL